MPRFLAGKTRLRRHVGTLPYLELTVQLHGCVTDVEELLTDLHAWLDQYLPHECGSDIEVTLVRSAGVQDARFPPQGEEPEREPSRGGCG